MPVWSTLRPLLRRSFIDNSKTIVLRNMSDHGPRMFPIQPSRWAWNKFKDLLHFYVMLGAIPIALIVTYSNIFIGPAQLQEIPEDYTPKHWEYHRHPITRWFARYISFNPQQEHEKALHHIFEEEEKRRLRALEKKVKEKIRERRDFQAYYHLPVMGKYGRVVKEIETELREISGDN